MKRRFAELVPNFPFEGLFPPSVASTLAHQIYGYERKPRHAAGATAAQEPPAAAEKQGESGGGAGIA